MIHRVARRRLADPDPQPGVVVGAELLLDVPQPVLPAVAALRPNPQLAERQVEVVADDQQLLERQLVEVERPPGPPGRSGS